MGALSAGVVVGACWPYGNANAYEPLTPAQKGNFEQWMDGVSDGAKTPVGTLQVARFKDYHWYTTRSLKWEPNPGQRLPSVTVPVGFVTDFASIPRLLWSSLPRDGDYVWAAVVHDYLYWEQRTTRDEADDVLNAAMEDLRVSTADRLAIYKGVQFGGASSWADNAKLRARGEKRVIKLFPPSPLITWSEWKARTDVF